MSSGAGETHEDADNTGWLTSLRKDSIVLGAAVGAVGLTFGVLAETAGLSIAKAMAMSLLVFTGASQFAAVGTLEAGGSPLSAVGGALLLAARNTLYGIRLAPVFGASRPKQFAGAHLTIDESTAMATAQHELRSTREAFWATGMSIFFFWNLGTAAGVVLGSVLGDPETFGLDAAFLASFVALIGPHVRKHPGRLAALLGAGIAIVTVPVSPAGVPLLLATLAVVPALWLDRRTAGSADGVTADPAERS